MTEQEGDPGIANAFTENEAPLRVNRREYTFLDTDAEGRERDALRGRADSAVRSFSTLIRSYSHDTPLMKLSGNRENAYNEILAVGEAANQLDTMTEGRFNVLLVHKAGTLLQYADRSDRLRSALSTRGVPAPEVLDLDLFGNSDPVLLKIHGVSIKDIVEQSKRSQLPLDRLFAFYLTPRLIAHDRLPEGFAEENAGPLADQYPNIQRRSLIGTADLINGMVNFARYTDTPEFRGAQREFPIAAASAKKLAEQTKTFHDRLKRVIVDPSDPEFGGVKTEVEKYFDDAPDIRVRIIHLLTYADNDTLKDVYRKSLQLVDHPEHGAFYRSMTSMIREYSGAVSDFTDLHTKDDLEEIFAPGGTEVTDPTPTTEDFRRTVAGIIENKPRDKHVYEIDTDNVSWGDIIVPQSAKVTFNPKKPMHFELAIEYENENEETNVEIEVDARKGSYDWTFIEDPDAPDMQPFADATKRVVKQALEQVDAKAREEKAAKRAARVVQEPAPATKAGGEKSRPEPEEEPVRRKRQRTEANTQQIAEEAMQREETGVRNVIVIPEEADMARSTRSLSGEEPAIIRSAIEEYNERGVGGFKMLAGRATDGSKLYVLRVNTGSGGVRVLLKEGEGSGNQRNFEILDIRRRGSVYKRNIII